MNELERWRAEMSAAQLEHRLRLVELTAQEFETAGNLSKASAFRQTADLYRKELESRRTASIEMSRRGIEARPSDRG